MERSSNFSLCTAHNTNRRECANFSRDHSANAIPPICLHMLPALWMSHNMEHFAAYRSAQKVRHKSASNAFRGAELCVRQNCGAHSKASVCQEILAFDEKRNVA